MSAHGPPRLHFELLSLSFNGELDLDLAYQSDANPDSASKMIKPALKIAKILDKNDKICRMLINRCSDLDDPLAGELGSHLPLVSRDILVRSDNTNNLK